MVTARDGRPTKYKPEYCQQLIDHMATGLSYTTFAAVINVNVDTLYAWEKNADFSEAKAIAFNKNLKFWEQLGIDGIWEDSGRDVVTRKLNSSVWIFNMKNRHRWKDRHDVTMDTSITDKTEIEREKIRKMSMAELKKHVKDNISEE